MQSQGFSVVTEVNLKNRVRHSIHKSNKEIDANRSGFYSIGVNSVHIICVKTAEF